MEEPETSRDIERIASHWVARMDRAPLSAGEDEELKRWLAGDRRRRGAFMRARAIWLRSESARALGPHYDPADFQPVIAADPAATPERSLAREPTATAESAVAAEPAATASSPAHVGRGQRLMKWGGAMAASFLLAVMMLATLQMPAAYATTKGEIRTVPLGDGTTVTLNTDTHIKVYDEEGRRRIHLVRGELLIETGPTAPTVVEVDGKHLEASAATFVVRKLKNQPAQVMVQDGRVVLADAMPSTAIPVSPNTAASLLDGNRKEWQLEALSFGQIGRELAWREGKIALQGETLAEAVAVYARYSDMPIVIEDPDLARKPVTGLFAINNPLGFSHAVADVFDAEVRQEGDRIVIAPKQQAL